MDWVERLTGISPDGGNGVTELMLMLALALTFAAVLAVILRRRRSSVGSSPRRSFRFWRAR